MLKVGSLFSGIGGIELGLERTGAFKTVWFVENDPHARAILAERWSETIIYDDITTTNFKDVPRIDVLTGGFPCQDISNAGKRVGITGSRSSLWKHYARAIGELRPCIALIENVAALTRRGLDIVLCDLAALGYDAEWHCFTASSVGAPHQRDRIAIIAYPRLCWHADGRAQKHGTEREGCAQHKPLICGEDVSNTFSEHKGWKYENHEDRKWTIRQNQRDNGTKIRGDSTKCSGLYRGWWVVEPDVGRVAYGVPARVDRIKRLGNAVVPQWAQAIGETIKEVIEKSDCPLIKRRC